MAFRNPFIVAVALCCLLSTTNAGQPRWQIIGQLPTAVGFHHAVMMSDGGVLSVGGMLTDGRASDQCALLDPQTGVARPLPSMPAARFNYACVAVNRGALTHVFVIGGYTGATGAYSSSNRVDKFSYDATTRTGTWRALGTIDRAVGDCRADFDGNSSIIVTGGVQQTTGAPGSGTPSASSWRIDVNSGSIQRLGDLSVPHTSHSTIRFVDQQGRNGVLSAGGERPSTTTVTELLLGSAWDARTNPPRIWRERGTSVCDRADIARVFGGRDQAGATLASCEWYDPKSGWRAAPRMNDARFDHSMTRVDGKRDTASSILVVGGRNATTLGTTELFSLPGSSDPVGAWESLPVLVRAVSNAGLSISAWNLPAVTGGKDPQNVISDIQMLQPLRAEDVSMPSTEVSSLSDSVLLSVTNTWVLPVKIDRLFVSGTSEFTVLTRADTSQPIAPGSTRTYLVWFRPTQEGQRGGDLILTMGPVNDTVHLSGIGLRSTVSLTTSGIDFGDVLVGSRRDTCIPLVVNQGTDTLRIDSIVVGNSEVSVLSPLGRIKVPPGETLTVCFRYSPTARGVMGTAASIHLGARNLPVSLIGRGIRRFVQVQSATACDTISAKPGDTVQLVAAITNPSDRTVRITAIQVTSTNPGSVTLDPSMTFPIDVPPNGSLPVLLVMQVIRESREDITITTTDNGDTLARGTICAIPRSRTLQLSMSAIDLGVVCGGTTLTRTIRIDNVSSFESIQIDTSTVSGMAGSTDLQTPLTLQPRSSVDVVVTLTVPITGPLSGRVSFDGPSGSTIVPITGTIAPTIEVHLDDATMVTGYIGRQIIRAGQQTPTTLSFSVVYPWRALAVRAVVETTIPLTARSTSNSAQGSSEISFTLSRAPVAGEEIAAIEYDVLRADVLEATVLTGPSTTEPCVAEDTSIATIDPFCGSSSGFIYLSTKPALVIEQLRSGETVLHLLNARPDGDIVLHNVNGTELRRTRIVSNITSIDCSDLDRILSFTFVGADGTIARSFHVQH